MLENSNATANLAVKDLGRAKAFYEGTLGLSQVDEMGGELIVYKSGDTRAMPLPDFIAETMRGLAAGKDEVIVEAITALRDNPGSGEHTLVNAFNQSIKDNPIPMGH